ncbi:hypothetical protein HPB50_015594 [Hyalomma asiaticum]|uniref:Uncharacterized protein n=1 Tax=Hyalomma asiaticum TaxID=266040 RepID=A0ACB7SYQ0_HYAAI|nr:hypothetical protein HPB50_015594 [Hyalomma asiaticum]
MGEELEGELEKYTCASCELRFAFDRGSRYRAASPLSSGCQRSSAPVVLLLCGDRHADARVRSLAHGFRRRLDGVDRRADGPASAGTRGGGASTVAPAAAPVAVGGGGGAAAAARGRDVCPQAPQGDKVFRLNLANINRTKCNDRSLSANKDVVSTCVYKGKREDYECRNHIKVIQPIGDGTKLYICGTNAQNPRDMEIYSSNLTEVSKSQLTLRDIGRGIGKCPFDPDDNSTAVWVEHGNPGDMPGLYSGTVAEFTKADTVIFRSALFNRTTHEQSEFFMRTLKYDSMWLDKPNFVGSFDIGDHVFFFFRESAVEYINCGKVIYSRVARVCKKDTGGKNILTHNWATFLKARLNCSLPGEYPFYFNEIQAVYKFPDDDSNVYAVFTTSLHGGPHGSAVCSFRLSDIQGAFGGKFKEQKTSSSAWLPVLTSQVPEPRPGRCVNSTKTLPDAVLNFLRTHTLMDSAVPQSGGRPVFYRENVVFLSLAVHKVDVDGVDYLVYFAGTRDGLVYKIVEWKDRSGQSFSNLVDIIEASPGEPVRTIDISSEVSAGVSCMPTGARVSTLAVKATIQNSWSHH